MDATRTLEAPTRIHARVLRDSSRISKDRGLDRGCQIPSRLPAGSQPEGASLEPGCKNTKHDVGGASIWLAPVTRTHRQSQLQCLAPRLNGVLRHLRLAAPLAALHYRVGRDPMATPVFANHRAGAGAVLPLPA